MRLWNAQKGERRWITFILTKLDFYLQHYQLPLPVFYLKYDHYWSRPSRKLLLQIQMYLKKSTRYSVQLSICMLLYALFILFPVRQTAYFLVWCAPLHWRSKGTHHGLETFVQWIWQIRFYPRVHQSFKKKQPISHIKQTTRTRFC